MFKLFRILKCDHDYQIIRTTKHTSLIHGAYDRHIVYCPKCDSITEKTELEWEEYSKIREIKNNYQMGS